MRKKKILALILSVAMLCGVMPTTQLSASEEALDVYLDTTNGSDNNDGSSADSAFQSLDKAVATIESAANTSGFIHIVGTLIVPQVPNKPRAAIPDHSKPIIVRGVDSSSVLSVKQSQLLVGGPTTFENITISDKFTFRCEWNEVKIGKDVKMAESANPNDWHELITGAYGQYTGNANPPREKVTIDQEAKFYTVWIGNNCNYNIPSNNSNLSNGVDYIQNGGSVTTIRLGTGSNGEQYSLGNKYKGDINIIINGGTIGTAGFGGILTEDSAEVTSYGKAKTDFNGNAVQIIFNNGTISNVKSGKIPTAAEIEAKNGVYYMLNCVAGGTLTTTETAGIYTVTGDRFAVATDRADSTKVYYSKNGKLTVPSGTYDVTWTDTVEAWEITAEAVEGTAVVPTDYDNMFNVTVPAGKLAAALDRDNNVVYVAEDKSVADKTPKTAYVSTKYTDWGCFENNGSYLTNTRRKLTEDKKLTVVYFGGSLTNGYGCGESGDPNGTKSEGITRNEYSWRALSGKWLKDNFSEAAITTVDAAIGESGTFLGTYRVQADIIAQKPDLLFLEYAINDTYYGSSESEAALQFETIVREVKHALPDCDIVTVLTTDKTFMSDSYNGNLFAAAKGHKRIAQAYGLPVANIGFGLAKGIAEKESNSSWWSSAETWKKYFCDNVHPYSTGHEQYYLCMKEFLENNLLYTEHTAISRWNLPAVQSEHLLDGNRKSIYGADMKDYFVTESSTGASFNSGTFVTGTSDTPRVGYYQVAANGSITFRFTGTEFTVWSNLYKPNTFAYSLDGGAAVTVTAGSHAPTQVVKSLNPGEHTITITPGVTMQIAGIFVRDESAQTVRGATSAYSDYQGMTLTLPAGSYHVYYAATAGELPAPATSEGQQFAGWKDAEGNILQSTDVLTAGMRLTAEVQNVCEVYVSASGDDSNAGTKDAPFKTLAKAVEVIKASGNDGVIDIVKSFTIDDTNRRMNSNPYTKMITIRGADETAVLNITKQLNLGGPLTIDNISVNTADNVIIQCLRHAFAFGSSVNLSYKDNNLTYAPRIITGTYAEYPRVEAPARESGIINGGQFNRVHLGNSATSSNYYTNSGGSDLVLNSGRIYQLWLGADGWANDRLGYTNYLGDVNYTMNGGILDQIKLADAGAANNHNGHAIQLIFNHGTKVDDTATIPTVEAVNAKNGRLYIMNCAMQGGTSYLTTTGEAGVYEVHGKLKAVAVNENGQEYASAGGKLTVPEGIYTVTWKLDDSPITVYVDETNGSDNNEGTTAGNACKTLNAAVEKIQNSDHATGMIKVVGTVTIDGTTQSDKLEAHTKMITIMGQDTSGVLYLKGKSLITNGPLTIESITVTLSEAYIGFECGTHEFHLGKGITNNTYPYMRAFAGPKNTDSGKLTLSMDSGNLYDMIFGVQVNVDGNTDEIRGLDYVHSGGQLTKLLLGSNAWEQNGTKFYPTAFTDNVNITLNGGQVGEIALLKPIAGSVSQTERDVFFKKAVQLLINDKGYMTSPMPEIQAEGGLWIINGHGSGYNLSVTDTAGVYRVPEGVTAIAYSEDGSRTYVSENGLLNVAEPGTYTVEYKAVLDYTNSGTEIRFYQDTTVSSIAEFAVKDVEGMLFAGWLDAEKNPVRTTEFASGTTLKAKFIPCNRNDNGDFFIKGVRIRESDVTQTMRFVIQLKDTLRGAFSDVTYGTVYAKNKVLGTKELVKDGSYLYDEMTYSAVSAAGTNWKNTDGALLYTTNIDGIAAEDYQVSYAVKGYLAYTDQNGISRTAYTDELVTSVTDTAEKLLDIDPDDESLLRILAAGKTAMQETYSGMNEVTADNIIYGTIGSNFNNGTVIGTNNDVAMKYYQLDNGLTVRDVTLAAAASDGSGKETTVIQISDPHFNYCDDRDVAEGNPSTLSTWNYRDLNKLWSGNLNRSVYNMANSLEYAKAYGDKTVVTGDVIDYISHGTIELMKRYINTPYPDTLVTLGNHDPIRVMGLPNDVKDPSTLASRYDLLGKNWNNDLYYTSELVNGEVMVIQLDNSQNQFWSSQIPLLTKDLKEARENGYTVLLFMHVPLATGNSADTNVEALIGMDGNYNDYYNGKYVIKSSMGGDTRTVYDLITSYGDVVKGIFTGHMHSDFYTEVLAKDQNGNDTYIPQYVLTGNFYGKGHVLKITVKDEPAGYNTAVLYDEQHSSYDAAAEAKRQELLNVTDTVLSSAAGTVYYVSPYGNDKNDGKTKKTAWKSLERVEQSRAALKSGDAVLFQRGGVYRGNMILTSGVSYGAYGDGAKPCVYGSTENYARPGLWQRTDSEHIWKLDTGDMPDIGNIVFEHGENCGLKKLKNTLTGDYEFYHDTDNGVLYLYLSSGNPGIVCRDVEICSNTPILSSEKATKDVLVENLCLKYSGAHGIVFRTGSENITIQGCEIGYVGGSMLSGYGSDVRYGNGIEILDNCDTININSNWVYQCYDAGITHQSSNTAGCKQQNITISGNLIEYCTYNIEYYVNVNNGLIRDTVYENNIFRFAGFGFGSVNRIGSDNSMDSNICCYVRGMPCRNFVIRNNVFDSPKYYQTTIGYPNDTTGQRGPVIRENSYIQKGNEVAKVMADGNVKTLYASDPATLKESLGYIDSDPASVIYEK